MSLLNDNNVTETTEKKEKKFDVKTLLLLLLLLITFGAVGFAIKTATTKPVANVPQAVTPGPGMVIDISATDEETKEELTKKLSEMFVTVAGFADKSIAPDTEIYLINSDENDENVYMSYTITNEAGEVIFKTDLIPVGTHITWLPYEYLEEGENNITIVSAPFYAHNDNFITLTSGANAVTYTK